MVCIFNGMELLDLTLGTQNFSFNKDHHVSGPYVIMSIICSHGLHNRIVSLSCGPLPTIAMTMCAACEITGPQLIQQRVIVVRTIS